MKYCEEQSHYEIRVTMTLFSLETCQVSYCKVSPMAFTGYGVGTNQNCFQTKLVPKATAVLFNRTLPEGFD